MGSGNFVDRSQIATAKKIRPAHITNLMDALEGAQYGRQNGVPTAGQDLGDATRPFGSLYAQSIIVNGQVVDVASVSSVLNSIVSGATSADSSMPKFLSVPGDALTCKILGATTPLKLVINGTSITIDEDITITGLTATPSANNTLSINAPGLSSDRYIGEPDYINLTSTTAIDPFSGIPIDSFAQNNVLTEGRTLGFRTGTNDIMLARRVGNFLVDVRREWFFRSNNSGAETNAFSDNTTFTALYIGWIFIDKDAPTSPIVVYDEPAYGESSPSSASTGDMWFRPSINRWYRYDGTTWGLVERIPIGMVAMNNTAAVGYRCFDFEKEFSNLNTSEWKRTTVSKLACTQDSYVNVYGTIVRIPYRTEVDITDGTNTRLTPNRDDSTFYWVFVTEKGQMKMDSLRPQYRADLKGYYHPFETWRAVAVSYNNSSDQLVEHGAAYFPWQKYNPSGIIPDRFACRVAENGTLQALSQANGAFNSVTKGSAGLYQLNFKSGFFSSTPQPVGLIALDNVDNTNKNIKANSISTSNFVFRTYNQGINLENNSSAIEIGFADRQYEQVQIDNRLKG